MGSTTSWSGDGRSAITTSRSRIGRLAAVSRCARSTWSRSPAAYSNTVTSGRGPRDAVIAGYVCSPIGRYGSALADVRPDTLAATTIIALLARTAIDPAEVDDVI